jgi:cytochrome c biogenesis protein CcmG/thiol:disulfide interchange protein DsbE
MALPDPPGKGRRPRISAVMAPVAIFAVVAGVFAFALQKGDPSKVPSALIGKAAPQITLPPVAGLTSGGSAIPGFTTYMIGNGRPAVVNFWASWCLPCVEEHPHLVTLAKQSGVAIYGINHKDLPANAAKFLAQHGNPFTAIGADNNGRAAIEWGVYGMPETFVIDGAGRIAFKHVGPITAETLASKVLPAIASARGNAPAK